MSRRQWNCWKLPPGCALPDPGPEAVGQDVDRPSDRERGFERPTRRWLSERAGRRGRRRQRGLNRRDGSGLFLLKLLSGQIHGDLSFQGGRWNPSRRRLHHSNDVPDDLHRRPHDPPRDSPPTEAETEEHRARLSFEATASAGNRRVAAPRGYKQCRPDPVSGVHVDRSRPLTPRTRAFVHGLCPPLDEVDRQLRRKPHQDPALATLVVAEAQLTIAAPTENNQTIAVLAECHEWFG
jgi:hypothetical protein